MKQIIPKLYETDGIPFDEKIIYEKYEIKGIGFYWLIAELDKKNNLAFGYANLNDDLNSEWGYISISELLDNNAVKDTSWIPTAFKNAISKKCQFCGSSDLFPSEHSVSIIVCNNCDGVQQK